MMSSVAGETVREAIVRALRSVADYNGADVVGPAAVMWTDADRAWGGVVRALAHELTILTLGEYDPQRSCGPVPWLRMELANREAPPDRGPVVVYLPGVSRRELGDAAELPESLQPLAGLVVRCSFFTQRNGSDWTPAAFLSNDVQGLGLAMAGTRETKEALTRAFPRLLDTQVRDLRGRTLDSTDFDELLVDDPARQLLLWMNDPAGYQAALEANGEWDGFASLAKKNYKLDPADDGVLRAAQLLGDREGKWAEVWNRFAEVPQAYPHVVDALRAGKPDGMMALHSDSWPQDNDEEEAAAFAAVVSLANAPVGDVRARLSELHKAHEHRLDSVWAKIGQTPAAGLVMRLKVLAEMTTSVAVGSDVAALASHHADSGWRTDAAFLAVLSALELGHPSASAAEKVAESLYRPWLEETVRQFQAAWIASAPGGQDPFLALDEPVGTCAIFVDGLRFDVAAGLSEDLGQRGIIADLTWRIAGVPTVTATCKPAVTPVAPLLASGTDLSPTVPAGGMVNQESLKKLLGEYGWSYVPVDDVGDPSGRGWTEGGDIDNLGHSLGSKLAHQLPDQIRQLASRCAELLNAGWQRVVVVTDHGWLLLPAKLPKHHLPEHLTVVRKGRCARMSEGVEPPPGIAVLRWRWDATVRIALAPGIHAFEAGKAYEHGGLSPQESVVPRIVVTRPAASSAWAPAIDFSWVGLGLKVEVHGAPEGCSVDLRSRANDGSTSLAVAPKQLSGGKARLVVDDEHQGQAAVIVLVSPDETLLANTVTVIPES